MTLDVKYNDPSTLLTKIISIIYSENKDLISSQGFLFVYLTMYDSNFKNIRNSLIHARNFSKRRRFRISSKMYIALNIYHG